MTVSSAADFCEIFGVLTTVEERSFFIATPAREGDRRCDGDSHEYGSDAEQHYSCSFALCISFSGIPNLSTSKSGQDQVVHHTHVEFSCETGLGPAD